MNALYAGLAAFLAGLVLGGAGVGRYQSAVCERARLEVEATQQQSLLEHQRAIQALSKQDTERAIHADGAWRRQERTIHAQSDSLRDLAGRLGRVLAQPCAAGSAVPGEAAAPGLPAHPPGGDAGIPERTAELAGFLGRQALRGDIAAAYAWACYRWANDLRD